MDTIKDLENSSLGDLTNVLQGDVSVTDLDWLSPTQGKEKDNYPSESERQIIPQLQALWQRDLANGPERFIPNNVKILNKDRDNSADVKVEVERVAKKAMMKGLTSSELVSHLRERFSSEDLHTATDVLTKVAAEDGLIGNVYIDLSVFNTTKEALSVLGRHKTRLASFAVGKPIKEKKYTDASGKCLHLAKVVVDKMAYSSDVLEHYASHLRNLGVIASDEKISSKGELRRAFLASRYAAKKEEVQPEKVEGLSEENQKLLEQGAFNKMNEYAAMQEREARLAEARPLLAQIQNLLLAGKGKGEMAQLMPQKVSYSDLVKYAPEIQEFIPKSDLIGDLLADVSLYKDVPEAVQALKGARIRPSFIVSGIIKTPQGFAENVSSRSGIRLLNNTGDLDNTHAAEVLGKMYSRGALGLGEHNRLQQECRRKGTNPIEIIKMAKVAAANTPNEEITPVKKVASGGQEGSYHVRYAADKDAAQAEKRQQLLGLSKEAVAKGVAVSSIRSKVASMTPIQEAHSIIREAMANMDEVPAESLDKCTKEKYPLKKTAKLVMASKCSSCIHHNCNICRTQGVSFKMANVKKASVKNTSEVDPVTAMELSYGVLDLDLAGVVQPAKISPSVDITLTGRSIGRL